MKIIKITVNEDGSYAATGNPPKGYKITATVKGKTIVVNHLWEVAHVAAAALEESETRIEIDVTVIMPQPKKRFLSWLR